jgi:hypothetical protein
MSLYLTLSVHGAEPYEIGDVPPAYVLADVIETESSTCASEANADHLEDPSEETRERFRLEIVREATARLMRAGDSYRDPLGVTWTLIER